MTAVAPALRSVCVVRLTDPAARTKVRIANAFGVSADDLFPPGVPMAANAVVAGEDSPRAPIPRFTR